MKCIERCDDGKAIRVPDDTAAEFVRSGNWIYISKGIWRSKDGTRHNTSTAQLNALFPNRRK